MDKISLERGYGTMKTAIRYEGRNVVIDIATTHKICRLIPDVIEYSEMFRDVRYSCSDRMESCKVCMRKFEFTDLLSIL